ncbi:hypothetical protein PR202_ga28795 [Eleusine coracana subsp. coracana]|uniref:Potassium transporter n=1 Tax=Eleusine coracana subsp. coracana TaxID=191504 RepID=A0AAV5DKD0_ELECO|nr:hypothetical protein PR202_ga28795 [Eleusine coracana subsp. coracana]
MDPEFGVGMAHRQRESWRTTLLLAYQSLGVVYGDLSISPLYVYKSTFAEDITHSETNEEIFGALSFIFWTLTLIPLLKYVTIVLRADDNGEGGTFALYSLLCRHANVSLLPNRQVADEELSTYKLECPPEVADKSRVKEWLEKHKKLHTALLVMVMVGTCMVIGDGVLTPALSVFSAVSGLELSLSRDQHELYPSLILGYMGQAAYLSQHHNLDSSYQIGFYIAVPECVRWPVLVLAILASVVGSQAIISGTFSIINQSLSLSCFPRVKVVHTSDKIHGQIYIPEINWLLMVLCIAVTVGFRDTKHMGNASGLAVITVMLVTTCLMSLVIMLCWHRSPLLALVFFLFFGSVEALYFSASLIKFREGAWLPITLALILVAIMFVWHHTTIKKYEFDLQNKVNLEWLLALCDKLGMVRVPGIGLVYTDLTSGVPANFSRFVTNLPAFHRVLVFVCVKSVPVPHDVDSFETELVESLATFIKLDALFRCTDGDGDGADYERENALTVVGSNPLRRHLGGGGGGYDDGHDNEMTTTTGGIELAAARNNKNKKVRFAVESPPAPASPGVDERVLEELHELCEAREAGTAFILGHSHVKAKPGSSLPKKLAVGVIYNFLRRNCRGPDVALRVPPASLLEVGMVYVL